MNHFDSVRQIVGALEFGILVAAVSVICTTIARRLNRRYAIKAWLQRKLPGVSFNRIAIALIIVLLFFSCSVIGYTIVRRIFKPWNPLPEALYIKPDAQSVQICATDNRRIAGRTGYSATATYMLRRTAPDATLINEILAFYREHGWRPATQTELGPNFSPSAGHWFASAENSAVPAAGPSVATAKAGLDQDARFWTMQWANKIGEMVTCTAEHRSPKVAWNNVSIELVYTDKVLSQAISQQVRQLATKPFSGTQPANPATGTPSP